MSYTGDLSIGRKLIIYDRTSPDKFELAGKVELLTFILTFLSSTWYIKNPFLKSKINDVRSPYHCVQFPG